MRYAGRQIVPGAKDILRHEQLRHRRLYQRSLFLFDFGLRQFGVEHNALQRSGRAGRHNVFGQLDVFGQSTMRLEEHEFLRHAAVRRRRMEMFGQQQRFFDVPVALIVALK